MNYFKNISYNCMGTYMLCLFIKKDFRRIEKLHQKIFFNRSMCRLSHKYFLYSFLWITLKIYHINCIGTYMLCLFIKKDFRRIEKLHQKIFFKRSMCRLSHKYYIAFMNYFKNISYNCIGTYMLCSVHQERL